MAAYARVRRLATVVVVATAMAVIFGGGPVRDARGSVPAPTVPLDIGAQPLDNFVTDDSVLALARTPSTLYLGGTFTRIGPRSGGGVALTSAGARDDAFTRVDGAVYTTISDGAGGFYIGGKFDSVGGISEENLAHINADGSVDSSFSAAIHGAVAALALNGRDRLLIGGSFDGVDGTPRANAAAVDAATGALDQGFFPIADGSVRAFAFAGGFVYLAGTFHSVDGTSRNALAAVDAVTGALDPSIDVDTNGVIEALLVSGSTLYVGGQFSTFGGQSRNGLAAIDLQTGKVDTAFAPSTTGTVFALADSGSELYVGGSFLFIAGAIRLNVAALDPTTGAVDPQFSPFTVAPGANASQAFFAPVDALALDGSRLVLGGAFTEVDGAPRNNLAAVDAVTGAVEPDFNPDTDGQVFTLALSPGLVYAGGEFTSAPRVLRDGLAAVSTSTGGLLDSFDPPTTAPTSALALGDGRLYAATRLTATGHDVIALDPVTGAQLPNFTVHVSGTISALLYSGGRLYVAGSFGSINGVHRRNLAAVDPATGALDAGFDAVVGANHDVGSNALAIAAQADELYVGGIFSAVDHRKRASLAAINATTGRLEPFNAAVGGGQDGTAVSALQPAGARLYLGGSFSRVGGLQRFNVAAVDSGSGAPDPWFRANTNGEVAALALVDRTLLVGGAFTQIDAHRHAYAAELELATGDPTGFQPEPNDDVYALLGAPDLVAAGGAFTTLGGVLQQHLALYPGPAEAPG